MKTRTAASRPTKTRLIGCLALGLSVMLTASTALPQRSSGYQELPNFHKVNDNLYRGAQPKKGGLKRLAQLGIKTILNIREGNELARSEETEARTEGLRYFNIPLKRTGRPADEQIERVLAVLNKAENQPVFVHCQMGADRTGMVIAIYRITHDGWTSERAKAEANKYGMHPWEVGMKNYIHDFYERGQKLKAPAAATAIPR